MDFLLLLFLNLCVDRHQKQNGKMGHGRLPCAAGDHVPRCARECAQASTASFLDAASPAPWLQFFSLLQIHIHVFSFPPLARRTHGPSSCQGSQVSHWRPSMPGTVCLAGGPVGSRLPPPSPPRAACISSTVELCPLPVPGGNRLAQESVLAGVKRCSRTPWLADTCKHRDTKRRDVQRLFQLQEANLDSFRWKADLDMEGPRHGFVAFQS